VTIKFYPLCSHQTKISFLGNIIKMLPLLQQDLHLWAELNEAVNMFRKFDKASCITSQSTLLFTSMFKAYGTSVFHLSVQIKKLSLSWNEIGNSGAKALATCLWNIDELDLEYCDITECEELCNAIQSLKRPVSFNLVSRQTVL